MTVLNGNVIVGDTADGGYRFDVKGSGRFQGPLKVAGTNANDSPLRITGPGSNLGDGTLLELTATGELTIAGGSGNGYRLAEVMPATNPSGWSGVIKVKNPVGVVAGYLILYSNP